MTPLSIYRVRAFLLKRPACIATHHEIARSLRIERWQACAVLSYMRWHGLVECVRQALRGRNARKQPGLWQLTIKGVDHAPKQGQFNNQHTKGRTLCEVFASEGKTP